MYSILYVYGWDHTLGEATGGRCLAEVDTLGEAIRYGTHYAAIASLEWDQPGWIAITNPDHQLVVSMPTPTPPCLTVTTATA